MTRLYLAYGSNLNKAQMRRRCPNARPIKVIWLDDAKLVFRGVADLEYVAGETTPCGLWEISASDETALDRYEGVSAGLYEKKMVALDNGDEALVYVMTSDGIAPPSRDYYEAIKKGYQDFEINLGTLRDALKHSYTNEQHTQATRQRRAKAIQKGQFVVARPSRDAMVNDVEAVANDVEAVPRETAKLLPATSSNEEKTGTAIGRAMDGYNWSQAARNGTATGNNNWRLATEEDLLRRYKKKGKRRFYTEEEIQTIAERARKNHKPNRPRKNLSDWLADKNNRY